MTTRKGDWFQTYTGIQFWPLDPRADEVCIEDIAHALSNICRYNGHVKKFYSVAEHSVLASFAVAPEHALTALMHDATEAYCCDIPRPIKRDLANYAEIEGYMWGAIAKRFDLPMEIPQEVIDVDNGMLLIERDALMGTPPAPWSVDGFRRPEGVSIGCWTPKMAESLFMGRFIDLYQNRRVAA